MVNRQDPFCHVKDHSIIACNLMERVNNKTLNIGFDEETRIKDLAKILHEVLNNLEFVRGNFEALDITKKTKISEIRKTYPNKKIFICPGLCGDCTKIGHACGDLPTFKGYSIIIPKH